MGLKEYPAEMPWAIVRVRNQMFAVAAQDLREMLILPEVAAVPNAPDYIRGVINLRGRVMPLVDIRKRLGMVSAAEEISSFCELMVQREQDHRNWLNELAASVEERRPFKLTTDPHRCAFGKWYDTYRPENGWVAALLKKFDEPHQKIHAVGVEVETLKAGNEYAKVAKLIENTRATVLASMIKLFADLRTLVQESHREIALVLTAAGNTFAASIDSAVSIEKLAPGSVAPLPHGTSVGYSGVVQRGANRAKENQLLMIIETDRLLLQN